MSSDFDSTKIISEDLYMTTRRHLSAYELVSELQKKDNKHPQSPNTDDDISNDLENCTDDSHDKDSNLHENRTLVVLGINMTNWQPYSKYFVLTGGMMITMCCHGYLQEFLMYGWFGRKLSVFAALLHFFFFSILAFIEKRTKDDHGTASSYQRKLPWMYHILFCILKSGTMFVTNMSMTQINYPAKVLFKSASPIITMIIGVIWFRKTYKLNDYIVVFLLVLGLYIFLSSNSGDIPQWTIYGLVLAVISVIGSSLQSILQEYWMYKFNSSYDEMLSYSFYGSTIISFFTAIFTGELILGIKFLLTTSTIKVWIYYFFFVIFGFLGAHFATALTAAFGALLSGITFTARKAVTLGISFALFPDRNILTIHHIFGTIVFMSGLILRTFLKSSHSTDSSITSSQHNSTIENKRKYKDSSKLVSLGKLKSLNDSTSSLSSNNSGSQFF